MGKNAAAQHYLSKALCFLVLLTCLRLIRPVDTYSLSCYFIVKARTTPGQPWFEVQCSVDGVPFYNNNKAMPLGGQGKEVNATKECADFFSKLKDIGEELRKQLLIMEKEAVLTRDHHTLQVIMASQYKGEQFIDAFWNFTMDAQYSFLFNRFNPKNKTWGVIHDKDTGIVEKLKNNDELAQDLATLSMGDSSLCLKELLNHWKEMPRSISRTTDVTQLTSAIPLTSTTPLTSTSQFDNNKESIITPVAISIIIPFTIICIFMCSLLLLFLCSPTSSSHHQLCQVTLEHCLRLLQQSKQMYF